MHKLLIGFALSILCTSCGHREIPSGEVLVVSLGAVFGKLACTFNSNYDRLTTFVFVPGTVSELNERLFQMSG